MKELPAAIGPEQFSIAPRVLFAVPGTKKQGPAFAKP